MKKIIILLILGAIFRFYKINWDENFFLHPDERGIGGAVWWFSFGKDFNPHFFAYGSFPIYLNFLLIKILQILKNLTNDQTWGQSMLMGRLISAFLSTSLIPLVYFLTKRLTDKKSRAPLLAAFFTTTSVGLIQYAHFATYEIILTFENLLLLWLLIKLISQNSFNRIVLFYTFLSALMFGLMLATKITTLALFPLPFLALLFSRSANTKSSAEFFREKVSQIIFFLVIALLTAVICAPYNILEYKTFLFSINYESAVAAGKPVFFTAGFLNTIPFLFQLTKIFPWIANPFLTVLIIPALFWLIYRVIKFKNRVWLLIFLDCALLFSQAFLFVKWTRYMVPVLPLIYITISLFLVNLKNKIPPLASIIILIVLTLGSLGWCLAFFSIYTKTDTRLATARWMIKNIPPNAQMFTEDLDSGYSPIRYFFPQLRQFNFYELDGDGKKEYLKALNDNLKYNDYFIVLSRSVYETRIKYPDKFPQGAKFYQDLFSGKLGYEKIYQSENPFGWAGLTIDDNSSELTFQVFDHPELMVFKKDR